MAWVKNLSVRWGSTSCQAQPTVASSGTLVVWSSIGRSRSCWRGGVLSLRRRRRTSADCQRTAVLGSYWRMRISASWPAALELGEHLGTLATLVSAELAVIGHG